MQKQKNVQMFPMYFPHLLLGVSIKSHVLWVSGPLGPATTHLARVHGLFSSGPQGPLTKGLEKSQGEHMDLFWWDISVVEGGCRL